MAEPVRLIIWDLDNTFWAGTLTEGGIAYNQANHDLIIALARRGIMSTICSKNDHDAVKAILVERGIWDYFVFPSINWNPKGARIRALIEDIQLRPESVMLLDDNALNLNEAKHFVPGIQIAPETFIPEIAKSPLFKGKDDESLSRLAQYKLLEKRKADESVASDNVDFLRSCDIRVEIELDVETHLDRAIELINRTNQLNFTKKRLPENAEKARRKLRKLLPRIGTQAGLVRVTDRYGDYGYCGFYLARTKRGKTQLSQFCFSCRILNMGVENWLYDKLGRPEIEVQGDVLTDLSKPVVVDWINVGAVAGADAQAARRFAAPVVIRGACTVSPLVHYFQMDASDVAGEFNDVRDSVMVRRDHTLMLRYAIEGVSARETAVFRELGFVESDFETRFTDTSSEPALRILSNWVDSQDMLWRHRETGLLVPYKLKRKKSRRGWSDEDEEDNSADSGGISETAAAAEAYLHRHFDFAGELSRADAAQNFDVILGALPAGSPLFVISAPETPIKRNDARAAEWSVELNWRTADAAARHPDKLVIPIAIADLAKENERHTASHFHRHVYHRLYETIRDRFREVLEQPAPPRPRQKRAMVST